MQLTYTVDSTNFSVKVYSDEQEKPIIFQPDWPNGTPWGSFAEAENWAQLCINSIEDAAAPYAPAGPGIDPEPKPT